MNPFEMVVLIVAVVMLASVLKNRQRAGSDQPAERETEALHTEISRLKDRIEVLERLATDKSRRLADEIDSLRK